MQLHGQLYMHFETRTMMGRVSKCLLCHWNGGEMSFNLLSPHDALKHHNTSLKT